MIKWVSHKKVWMIFLPLFLAQSCQQLRECAMCVICDINEYRKCVRELKSPLIDNLFDTLHALCNLLLVKPENLNQVCNGENLAPLEGSILLNFIQLRSDYKTQKLSNFLKGITT